MSREVVDFWLRSMLLALSISGPPVAALVVIYEINYVNAMSILLWLMFAFTWTLALALRCSAKYSPHSFPPSKNVAVLVEHLGNVRVVSARFETGKWVYVPINEPRSEKAPNVIQEKSLRE